MGKKHKSDNHGYVYSTDPSFMFEHENESLITIEPALQKIVLFLETKQRGGKTVTIAEGFIGTVQDLELLAKQLKNTCGTGGSVKDGQIIIQGDQREKILQWLLKNGYTKARKR
jgi:translation initiation factor 1